MAVHFPMEFIQQKSPPQIQQLVQSIYMKLIDVRLIRRGHSAIIGGQFCRLFTALDARPAIPALDEVGGRLALVVLDLKTGDVRSQPVYPGKAACDRVGVLILQDDGN